MEQTQGLVVDKFYIFAVPWDWTFVGRFSGHIDFQHIVIEDGGYFTRTGATFDVLCRKGFTADTKFHPCGRIIIPAQGPKFEWHVPTPWVKK